MSYLVKSNFENELNFFIWAKAIMKGFDMELLKSPEPYYACSVNDFEIVLPPNQALFIKNIEALVNDISLPLTATVKVCSGDEFIYKSDLVTVKPNGDEVYKIYSELNDLGVVAISDPVNIRQARIIGWLCTFDKNLSDPIIIEYFGIYNLETSNLTINNQVVNLIVGENIFNFKIDVLFDSLVDSDGDVLFSVGSGGSAHDIELQMVLNIDNKYNFNFKSLGGGGSFTFVGATNGLEKDEWMELDFEYKISALGVQSLTCKRDEVLLPLVNNSVDLNPANLDSYEIYTLGTNRDGTETIYGNIKNYVLEINGTTEIDIKDPSTGVNDGNLANGVVVDITQGQI